MTCRRASLATNQSGIAAASASGSSSCQMTSGSLAANSAAVITRDTDFSPSASAVSCACSISLYPDQANPAVNVSMPGRVSAASAQIADESTPPDRNAPTGTSLRK